MEEQVKALEQKLEEQASNMQLLMQMIKEIKDSSAARNGASESPRNSFIGVNSTRPQGMIPKLQFPTFDGTNPRNWIKKCSRYFTLCNIAEECRVNLASLYMTEKAETWVSSYLAIRKDVEWDDFIIDLTARFKDGKGINAVEQFNKLEQGESLEDYIDEFENLRSVLLQNGHRLPEEFILDSFVGGLKPTIKPFVRAFNPTNISEAVKFARLQEEQLIACAMKTQPKISSTFSSIPSQKSSQTSYTQNLKPPLLPTPQIKPSQNLTKFHPKPFKHIPADVRAQKIAKGLCYYCDQKYEKGHKCQFREPQLFTVEIQPEYVEDVVESDEEMRE